MQLSKPSTVSPTLLAVVSALLALAGTQAQAQDRADIDRTQIIGNRELPKVLYIVPWKKPLPGELSGKPGQSVLDEVLAPVDRDVLRRQVRYNDQVKVQQANTSTVLAPSVAAPGANAVPAAPAATR